LRLLLLAVGRLLLLLRLGRLLLLLDIDDRLILWDRGTLGTLVLKFNSI
jgi:hypothetical protein